MICWNFSGFLSSWWLSCITLPLYALQIENVCWQLSKDWWSPPHIVRLRVAVSFSTVFLKYFFPAWTNCLPNSRGTWTGFSNVLVQNVVVLAVTVQVTHNKCLFRLCRNLPCLSHCPLMLQLIKKPWISFILWDRKSGYDSWQVPEYISKHFQELCRRWLEGKKSRGWIK